MFTSLWHLFVRFTFLTRRILSGHLVLKLINCTSWDSVILITTLYGWDEMDILLARHRHLALYCCLIRGQLLDLCSLGSCEHLLLELERIHVRGVYLTVHILLLLLGRHWRCRCREVLTLMLLECLWLVIVPGRASSTLARQCQEFIRILPLNRQLLLVLLFVPHHVIFRHVDDIEFDMRTRTSNR